MPPVLVRSSLRTWDFTALLVAGGLLIAAGGVLGILGIWLAAGILAVVGAGCVLGSVIGKRRRFLRRRWVEDLGDRFRVIDAGGEREVPDDQVLSVALLSKQNHVNGILKSVTRQFIVWLATEEGAPERLEMKNVIKVGATDALAPLANRVIDLLCRRAAEDLAAGHEVLGEHWSLQGDNLLVRIKGQEWELPRKEIEAVQPVDDMLCIWQTGKEDAVARVPQSSANAQVLWRLLHEELAKRKPSESAPPDGQGLGRLIFERKTSRVGAGLCAGIAVMLLGMATFLLLSLPAMPPADQANARTWTWICLGGAVCLIPFAIHLWLARFRCHERGVYKAGLLGKRTLRYEDVDSFLYTATRHFHNGVYTGTVFTLRFGTAGGGRSKSIGYHVSLKHADQELENLRDFVSRVIASRMGRQLGAGQPVTWTKRLRFLPQDLEYQRRSFFSRKDPLVIPYTNIYWYSLQTGYFYLWVREQPKKPLLTEGVGVQNFFPGYYLLASMLPLSNSSTPAK